MMKIIATMGPSILEKIRIKELISSGVNVFRFNFSHGTLEEFSNMYNLIKEIDENVHIMGDLSGGKIRISEKLPYIYKIYNGDEVLICGEDKYEELEKIKKNKMKIIPINLNSKVMINKNIKNISMKDNTMHFKIIEYNESGIRARVKRGGIIRGGKGCNIKGLEREKGILTEKDKEYLNWCIKEKIEIVCQSFVEEISDVEIVKKYIKERDENYIPIIWAKIETPKGVKNALEISKTVEGIVIGRGDLIPESSLISAPIYQIRLIEKINSINGNKDLIVGTHILNSMKNGKRPEFAEVDCIYNLISKKVNGFLLSGETSIGRAPVKTVRFLKELTNTYEGMQF